MTKMNTTAVAFFLAVVLSALAGITVLKGGLYIGKYEGDTLHLMQIVFRMADGQIPHLDFMTPIGALAFWPIAMLIKAGLGIGMAFIWSQILMALVFLPIVLWVGWTRLTPWVAALFGGIVMVLLLALVHGEEERAVAISMHYNRLAWAAAFVAMVTCVLPSRRSNSVIDGIIVGLMMAVLAMIKVTYFVPFAPPLAIALLMTGQRRAFGIAVLTGLAVIGIITMFTGLEYWAAYVGDLLIVATSEGRSAPGDPLGAIMGAPAYLGGTLIALGSVILLRQGGVQTGGLIMLLLLPGFFYVTYQNFGNDPQWLLVLGVLVLAFRPSVTVIENPFGWDIRTALGGVAVMAFAIASGSFFNLAYSPFRHYSVNTAFYTPLLPRSEQHSDLQGFMMRIERVDALVALDGQLSGLARWDDRDSNIEFRGETFESCSLEGGLISMTNAIAVDLENAGFADGTSVFVADLFSSIWMFGSLEPMAGGAPWYYGGLPGLPDAEYVLIPFCPVLAPIQRQILETMDEIEVPLSEVRRTDLYILYSVDR